MIYSYIYFTTINAGVNKIDCFSHFKRDAVCNVARDITVSAMY